MTRINGRLLVQSPDGEVVVLVDEESGEEIQIAASDVMRVIRALHYFATPFDARFADALDAAVARRSEATR